MPAGAEKQILIRIPHVEKAPAYAEVFFISSSPRGSNIYLEQITDRCLPELDADGYRAE